MNINELTLGQIKEIRSLVGNASSELEQPFIIGKAYFIRTVTMHLIGIVDWVGEKELKLSQASWIADSGRFHDAIKSGKLNEVEPFITTVIVGRASIIDATEWAHKIPTEQK